MCVFLEHHAAKACAGGCLFPLTLTPDTKRNSSRTELPRDGAQHLRLPLLSRDHGALAQVVVQPDRLAGYTLSPERGHGHVSLAVYERTVSPLSLRRETRKSGM